MMESSIFNSSTTSTTTNEILSTSSTSNTTSKVSFSIPLSLLSNQESSPINSPTSSSGKKFFIPSIKTAGLNGLSSSSSNPSTPKTPTTPNGFNSLIFANRSDDLSMERLDRRELENEITFIDSGIYLGNLETASNLAKLQKAKVTNILNCSGDKSTNYFPQHFKYKTLSIRDIPDEDISCLFFIILDYFIKVSNRDGVMFVHCYRGVSRSSAFVILWLMWKNKWSYQKTFEFLVEKRKVASPNIGFEFQLRRFEKYCQSNNNNNNIPSSLPVYNSNNNLIIMKQLIINDNISLNNNSSNNSININQQQKQISLLYKLIKRPDSIIIPQPVVPIISSEALDNSSCYILRTSDSIYIWYGVNCNLTLGPKPIINYIKKYINRIKRFENDNSNIIELINCNNSSNNNNNDSSINYSSSSSNIDYIKFKTILDSSL